MLRDTTMQCPIALRVCVILVGAVRETPAGYAVCRPGVVGCAGVCMPVCVVRTWAFLEPPLRRCLPAWCCAMRRCMNTRCMSGFVIPVGAVRETPLRRRRSCPALWDAVVRERPPQCPIALRVCVIPVGAFRETPAGHAVCRPGVVRCRGVCVHVCVVRSWAFHETPLRRLGRPGVARCHDAMPDRVARMCHSRRGGS